MGDGDTSNPGKSRLANRCNRSRNGKIVTPEIASMVDPRQDPVRTSRHEMGQGYPGTVSRSSTHRIAPFTPWLKAYGGIGRDTMPDLRHLRDRGDDPDFVKN